ncbi:NADH dehydrogenase subunit I [Betaproteobacteria bacterium MOLA814]|nr:NADH dehydrogenase subunit I [Betaproteobacteria bacterium MOLA814]
MTRTLLCSCNGTMSPDTAGTGEKVHTALCRFEMGSFLKAAQGDEPLLVACTQEQALFNSAAEHSDPPAYAPIRFVNIRETAGWSSEKSQAGAKTKALLAVASLPDPDPVASIEYVSEGRLMLVGPASKVVAVAQLAQKRYSELQVSALITQADADLPLMPGVAWLSGSQVSVAGYLGRYSVKWSQTNPIDLEVCTRCQACVSACPTGAITSLLQIRTDVCDRTGACEVACASVGAIRFDRLNESRDQVVDLVIDLNESPLLRALDVPPGYKHATSVEDGKDALAELSQWVGRFDKPRYFTYQASICSHGRNNTIGCNKCIDVCSTQAITSILTGGKGRVEVNPNLCMGCGACSTVCPSGAMRYNYPSADYQSRALRTLVSTATDAGLKEPEILLHSTDDSVGGTALINRLGQLAAGGRAKGLPARVMPFALHHAASVGPELWLAALAYGAARVTVLLSGEEASTYRDALNEQVTWVRGVIEALGGEPDRVSIIQAHSPEALDGALQSAVARLPLVTTRATFSVGSDKRHALEAAIEHLLEHTRADAQRTPAALPVALPAGAPLGGLTINKDACTLCMSCVGACPQSALKDGGDQPLLSLLERDCVQCGLCVSTCPENALALAPRLSSVAQRRTEQTLHLSRPFHCVSCRKPFATEAVMKAMLTRVGGHSAFSGDALKRLSMCSDCRVIDMMEKAG